MRQYKILIRAIAIALALLNAVQPEQSCYEQVRAMVKILNYVQPAQVEDEIPPTSLVREFIGGNSFYRK